MIPHVPPSRRGHRPTHHPLRPHPGRGAPDESLSESLASFLGLVFAIAVGCGALVLAGRPDGPPHASPAASASTSTPAGAPSLSTPTAAAVLTASARGER